MEEATASALNTRLVIDAAAEVGISDRFLCEAVGLAPEVLETHGRIDKTQLKALWHAASRLSGDPFFGLHAAERLKVSAFGVVGFAIQSCANVAEAIELGCHCTPRFFRDTEVDFRIEGPVAHLRYRYSDAEVTSPHACDYMMAAMVTAGRRFTRVDWDPLQVTLQRDEPEDLSEHRRVFRAPLRFGSEWNVLSMHRSRLDLKLADSNRELRALLRRYVDDFLEQASQPPRTTAQVREVLGRTLRDGEPTLEETAKAMGLSPRALTRQLREEGSSFREILQSVRAMLARRYLLQRSLSDEDVSLLLGFEDPKAFRREFERWSGSSG